MAEVFEAPALSLVAPILADIGLATPVAITDIKDGSGRVFRLDLADRSAVVLKHYDEHYKQHYVVSGERYAERLLEPLDLPITRYLLQDESLARLPFPFAIANYLPGVTAKSLANEPDVADAWRQMGMLLRKLHSVAAPGYGKFGPDGVLDAMLTNAEAMRRSRQRLRAVPQVRRRRSLAGLETVSRPVQRHDPSASAVFAHRLSSHQRPRRAQRRRPPTSGNHRFQQCQAADAVSDLASSIFFTEHEMPGSGPCILEGYGPIDHPDPEGALWFYTLHHRVVMWWWLRHVGIIADGEEHGLVADLREMADRPYAPSVD